MTTLYQKSLLSDLKDHFIFLDTGVFIASAKSSSFTKFLIKLRTENNCSLSTISPVQFEFTSGSDTLDKYNKRVESLKSLVDYIDPLKFLDKIQDFYVVMAKVNASNKSQTDFLLSACLYNYQSSKTALITNDFKAFPAFLPRTHILTVEEDKANKHGVKPIRNFGVYTFDKEGYAQVAQSIIVM